MPSSRRTMKPRLGRPKSCPMFCVCDKCLGATAAEHRAADARCGRSWLCQCGACKRTREVLADIDARFARIKKLDAQLAAVRAIKAGS